jgi:hypothetical protein
VKHITANKILLLVMMTLHIAGIGSALFNTANALGVFGRGLHAGPERNGQLLAYALCGLWAVSGAIWAPLNAWGLHHKKPWARTSTMAYWAVQVLSCCCFPFGAYGLFAMTRKEVKDELAS